MWLVCQPAAWKHGETQPAEPFWVFSTWVLSDVFSDCTRILLEVSWIIHELYMVYNNLIPFDFLIKFKH